MCIIAIKKHGIDFPAIKTLENCFDSNPDGAGFMFVRDGAVNISKGYMTFNHLLQGLKYADLSKDQTIIYHFRIATSGGETEKQTHPFPISKRTKDLIAQDIKTDIGFAHNGIISKVEPTKKLSDTMIFVKSILAHPEMRPKLFKRKSKEFRKMVELAGSSRLVFFNKDYYIYTGTWETQKSTGLIFSNDGYKPSMFSGFYGRGGGSRYAGNYNLTADADDLGFADDYYDDEDLTECPQCLQDGYNEIDGFCFACDYDVSDYIRDDEPKKENPIQRVFDLDEAKQINQKIEELKQSLVVNGQGYSFEGGVK